MMTVLPDTVERDAAIPSPGNQFDVVLGPLSEDIAQCKLHVREVFYRELVGRTSFWQTVCDRLFPSLYDHIEEADDDQVVVTRLSKVDIESAHEALALSALIVPVRIPTPDE